MNRVVRSGFMAREEPFGGAPGDLAAMTAAAPPTSLVPATSLAVLVTRHQQGLWRYLRVLGAEPDLADDLLQETFVVALRRGLRDDGHAAVAAFLRVTARHLFCKHRRRRRARREVEEADRIWNEHCAHDDGQGWFAALQSCFDELSARSQRLLRGTYGEDRGRAEMAHELGISADGVKTALRRLRAALRRCIERRREEE
jgi:RNA polymerase sigma-70 factor (ECF subfamily)